VTEHRCPDCSLALRDQDTYLPPLDLTDRQLTDLHDWAAAFDRYSRQVPADRPYTVVEFLHWYMTERRIRSSHKRRSDQVEHLTDGRRRRTGVLATPPWVQIRSGQGHHSEHESGAGCTRCSKTLPLLAQAGGRKHERMV